MLKHGMSMANGWNMIPIANIGHVLNQENINVSTRHAILRKIRARKRTTSGAIYGEENCSTGRFSYRS